jgi:hypothetical protein
MLPRARQRLRARSRVFHHPVMLRHALVRHHFFVGHTIVHVAVVHSVRQGFSWRRAANDFIVSQGLAAESAFVSIPWSSAVDHY